MRTLLLPWILEALSLFFISWFKRSRINVAFFKVPTFMLSIYKLISSKVENVVVQDENSLLGLPDLALECILEKLSPAELSKIAGMSISLRNMCTSDHLWERHMQEKWGRLIGDVAYGEWQMSIIATKKRQTLLDCSNQKGIFGYFSWNRLKLDSRVKLRTTLPVDSIMSLYLSLETGKFWFPGQVFNRENGHVGFMLSCYDAELCYDSRADNFRARFSAEGRATVEHDIEWNRLRASAVDTPAHSLHLSDCLDDLKPGDHIEIQWRRNIEFPYGWWYGVVGHSEPCDGCKLHCQCHSSDTVLLEFKQYTLGSRWRETVINRKDHREIGDEANGFYGGIRKVYNEDEIWMWRRLWPTQPVE